VNRAGADNFIQNEGEDWPCWCCPVHGDPLAVYDDILLCVAGDSYRVRNGIPRFVATSQYSGSFGAQWIKYRITQLDSYTGFSITRDRIQRCLGEKLWNDLDGKHVLECGCGAGRFTEILLELGARVTSVDLSEAVDANKENFPQGPSHRIAQGDILSLPFRPRQFDVVVCLGVVQHTPSPEATIARLYEQVRPGGYLVLDHYTYNLSWYTSLTPIFRRILRRLPPDAGLSVTEGLVDIFLPLHRLVRNFYLGQVLLSRVSPVLCYYHEYPELNDTLQKEWALLDTHDYLTDWYKHYRTRAQLLKTIERLGLEDIWCERGGNGIEIRGRRPLS
jgi:SAM-dependent methyltransferase